MAVADGGIVGAPALAAGACSSACLVAVDGGFGSVIGRHSPLVVRPSKQLLSGVGSFALGQLPSTRWKWSPPPFPTIFVPMPWPINPTPINPTLIMLAFLLSWSPTSRSRNLSPRPDPLSGHKLRRPAFRHVAVSFCIPPMSRVDQNCRRPVLLAASSARRKFGYSRPSNLKRPAPVGPLTRSRQALSNRLLTQVIRTNPEPYPYYIFTHRVDHVISGIVEPLPWHVHDVSVLTGTQERPLKHHGFDTPARPARQ